MDTATQIVLGAATGEFILGKKAGNRAVLWGGVAGLLPDLDIIPAHFMDTVSRMAFHRGFSHSLIFALVFAPAAGWLIRKIHRTDNILWADWTRVIFWGIVTHILLDCFTTWGTQVFWPLDYRVAWNTIYVIDPLYSVPFALIIFIMLFISQNNSWRRRLNYTAILVSTGYLLTTVVNKQIAGNHFENALNNQGIEYQRYSTRPTPFNSLLWVATVEADSGFYEGYYSLLDKTREITFRYTEKNLHLIEPFKHHPDVADLLRLTKGYFTAAVKNGITVIYDFRYGRMYGWEKDGGSFVFEYEITSADHSGDIRISRKRVDRMPHLEVVLNFWRRIKGTE